MADSLRKEADAGKSAFAFIKPDSEEAGFAAEELENTVRALLETVRALCDLRLALVQLMPTGGADAK